MEVKKEVIQDNKEGEEEKMGRNGVRTERVDDEDDQRSMEVNERVGGDKNKEKEEKEGVGGWRKQDEHGDTRKGERRIRRGRIFFSHELFSWLFFPFYCHCFLLTYPYFSLVYFLAIVCPSVDFSFVCVVFAINYSVIVCMYSI